MKTPTNIELSDYIIVNSEILGGEPVFRGTRVPVSAIFENLKTSSVDEVLENFQVTREQVQCVLDFAAKSTRPLEHLRAG